MDIQIRLFARYRELVGHDTLTVSLPEGSTAGDAFSKVTALHPELAPLQASTLLAIDSDFVKPLAILHDGDELKLMPPVSGGA
ncbi:MAG TPA: MoaD/ThiS family protein [Chloroflexota bacterium]|nr:MoaD/ThiS family protein [Chloroflexota bacterium]